MPNAAFTQLHKQNKSKDCLSFHLIARRKLTINKIEILYLFIMIFHKQMYSYVIRT